MLTRFSDLVKFRLERLLLRGMYTRLLVMAAVVGLTSIIGGLLVLVGDSEFERFGEATWWAFLRLTDPGYLGDDQGTARRTISATLTVLGYVLFMGSLIAVMTQWLNQTIRDLERGLTPIARRDHVVVLGWTSRTRTIAREMFATEGRVRRFLALHDVRSLHFVLMVEGLAPTHREDLRHYLGPLWHERQVVMRSGSPLYVEHLRRVDYLNAAAILLPSEDVGPDDEAVADAATVKILRSIDAHSGELEDAELPLVVTEIFDVAHVAVARRAYRGPLEVIASDRLIGRLLALSVLHPGIAPILTELLAHGAGSEIHIGESAPLVGTPFGKLQLRFPRAIPLGWVSVRDGKYIPHLCPDDDDCIGKDDKLVLLSQSHADIAPAPAAMATTEPLPRETMSAPPSAPMMRILIIGWSDRVPDLVAELAAHHQGSFHVTIVATVSKKLRTRQLSEHAYGGAIIRNVKGDATKAHFLSTQLEDPYDRIVLVASDWLATGAQSDARTILSFLLVRDLLEQHQRSTRIAVELMDGSNQQLVEGDNVDVVVSPLVIGRVLAHVTLRRELRCVYEELLDADGPVIALRSPAAYGIPTGDHTFAELAASVGTVDVLMGIVIGSDSAEDYRLNPPKDRRCAVNSNFRLLVLRRRGRLRA